MCIVKSPKIDPATGKVPDPTVIRNPFLDGLDPQAKALRQGRSSLRIERGGVRRPTSPPPAAILPSIFPTTPAIGGQGTSAVLAGGSGSITRDMAGGDYR